MEIMIFDYSLKVWEFFAVVGVLLAILEIFTLGFFVLPIGLACLLTAATSFFLNSWLMVWLSLAFYLCFMIWVFQIKLKKNLVSSSHLSNVDAMTGKEVVVTQTVSGNNMGEVKLYGDRWNAYSASQKEYQVGERLKIIAVDGNKVVLD